MQKPRNFEEYTKRLEEHYKDFTFDAIRYTSSAGPLSSKWQDIDVLTWGKGGSCDYTFVLQGSRLTVHWVGGAAVFQFTEQPTWSQLMKEYELDYFMKKCVASPYGVPWIGWSITDAIQTTQEYFEELKKYYAGSDHYKRLVKLFNDLGGWDALEEDQGHWCNWLAENAKDVAAICGADWELDSRVVSPGLVWADGGIRVWVALRTAITKFYDGLTKALEEDENV